MSLLTALGFGLLIGAQHAFEPDHLAAVGTMLPGEASPRQSAARGAWWGLGHGAAIAAVGVPMILLGVQVPESLASAAEFVVGLMLIALGARALWNARRAHDLMQQGRSVRSLPIGLVHGLAGSGAAIILATANASTAAASIAFLSLFVVGSTAAMAAVAALLTLPLRRAATTERRTSWLLAVSGVLSVLVGVLWSAPHLVG